jgi:predicted small lipoprotein YifL
MMRPAILLVLLALAACGKQGALRPVPPATLPQKPADAIRALTPEEMLKLPPQANPARVDDPLSRAQDRPDDRFNLPPPR